MSFSFFVLNGFEFTDTKSTGDRSKEPLMELTSDICPLANLVGELELATYANSGPNSIAYNTYEPSEYCINDFLRFELKCTHSAVNEFFTILAEIYDKVYEILPIFIVERQCCYTDISPAAIDELILTFREGIIPFVYGDNGEIEQIVESDDL